MKSFFLILVMVISIGILSAIQPARKPFLQIKIDGKSYKSGDILTVKPGQKLMMGVELEGGRRDFCKFPDTYADIAGTADILSRGSDGLTYQLNGKKAEWKLLSENINISDDEYIKVNSLSTPPKATIGEFIKANSKPSSVELIVSSANFAQTSLTISIKASWQFSQEGKNMQEENLAESTIFFKVPGASNVWFSSRNIQATGIKNNQIQEKLQEVQFAYDSIRQNFYNLNFAAVQQGIRNLQNSITNTKTAIDEVKSTNPAIVSKVVFIGLPSDDPIKEISIFSAIKTEWASIELLVNQLKLKLGKLPEKPTKESKDELVGLIANYVDWQYKLPENTFKILPAYIPDLKVEDIQMPGNIHFIAEEKTITNYDQTYKDFNEFLDQRIEKIPNENQKISSTQSRLQAVRLFDGMLRSYFSSINWAEWKNTRE